MARSYGSGGGAEINDSRIDRQMVQVFCRFPDDVHVLMEFTTPDGKANPDFVVIRENAQCTTILYEVKNISQRMAHATIEGALAARERAVEGLARYEAPAIFLLREER